MNKNNNISWIDIFKSQIKKFEILRNKSIHLNSLILKNKSQGFIEIYDNIVIFDKIQNNICLKDKYVFVIGMLTSYFVSNILSIKNKPKEIIFWDSDFLFLRNKKSNLLDKLQYMNLKFSYVGFKHIPNSLIQEQEQEQKHTLYPHISTQRQSDKKKYIIIENSLNIHPFFMHEIDNLTLAHFIYIFGESKLTNDPFYLNLPKYI